MQKYEIGFIVEEFLKPVYWTLHRVFSKKNVSGYLINNDERLKNFINKQNKATKKIIFIISSELAQIHKFLWKIRRDFYSTLPIICCGSNKIDATEKSKNLIFKKHKVKKSHLYLHFPVNLNSFLDTIYKAQNFAGDLNELIQKYGKKELQEELSQLYHDLWNELNSKKRKKVLVLKLYDKAKNAILFLDANKRTIQKIDEEISKIKKAKTNNDWEECRQGLEEVWQMIENKKMVVFIDDKQNEGSFFGKKLRKLIEDECGFNLFFINTKEKLESFCGNPKADLVLLDRNLSDWGITPINVMKKLPKKIPVLILSAYRKSEKIVDEYELEDFRALYHKGALDYLIKRDIDGNKEFVKNTIIGYITDRGNKRFTLTIDCKCFRIILSENDHEIYQKEFKEIKPATWKIRKQIGQKGNKNDPHPQEVIFHILYEMGTQGTDEVVLQNIFPEGTESYNFEEFNDVLWEFNKDIREATNGKIVGRLLKGSGPGRGKGIRRYKINIGLPIKLESCAENTEVAFPENRIEKLEGTVKRHEATLEEIKEKLQKIETLLTKKTVF